MTDLTWYSKERADRTFATKEDLARIGQGAAPTPGPDLSLYATKEEVSRGDGALSARLSSVEATTAGAMQTAAADAKYATKTDLQDSVQSLGQRMDSITSASAGYASKDELSQYATSAGVAEAYATKESLGDYLKSADAANTYATKAALAAAQIAGGGQAAPDLSGLATKTEVSQAESTLSARIDQVKATADAAAPMSALAGYVKTSDAQAAYATKESLNGYLTEAAATETYSAKKDLEAYKAQATSAFAPASLAQEVASVKETAESALPKDVASTTYATKEELSGAEAKASEASAKAATAVQPDALSAYATTEALTKVKQAAEAAAEAVAPPFRSGERYSSPVTYYWPDYYDEAKGTSKWAKALKAAGTLGIVILNKDSGNWDEKNEDFGKQAARALAAGARRAVFYVKTQYGVASLPSNDPARNGVPNPDKYTKEYILGQIAKFTEQYGDVAQGVFLDETINGWGAQAGRVQWYKDLIAAIREQYGQNFYIVVNAGSNMSPEMCALDFDTAMMFEQDAGKFLNEDANAPVLPDHMRSYPSEKWWAVIHGVTKDNYRQVFEKLDTLPIGHAYITDGVLVEDPDRGGQWEPVGNPYANPPSEQLIRLTSSWIRGTLGLHLEVEDLKAQVEALKKGGAQAGANAGQAGKLLVLGPNDPVPAGTPDDTVIVRREA
jgi:mucin-associated surface protein (MASP), putative